MQYLINQPITVPFTSVGLTLAKTVFTPYVLLNGILTTITPTYLEIGGGLYTITFTPLGSGVFTIFIEGSILHRLEVVGKLATTTLQNVEDSSIGSWVWDKVNGTLTTVRQDGTTLASFNIVDTLTNASRERV